MATHINFDTPVAVANIGTEAVSYPMLSHEDNRIEKRESNTSPGCFIRENLASYEIKASNSIKFINKRSQRIASARAFNAYKLSSPACSRLRRNKTQLDDIFISTENRREMLNLVGYVMTTYFATPKINLKKINKIITKKNKKNDLVASYKSKHKKKSLDRRTARFNKLNVDDNDYSDYIFSGEEKKKKKNDKRKRVSRNRVVRLAIAELRQEYENKVANAKSKITDPIRLEAILTHFRKKFRKEKRYIKENTVVTEAEDMSEMTEKEIEEHFQQYKEEYGDEEIDYPNPIDGKIPFFQQFIDGLYAQIPNAQAVVDVIDFVSGTMMFLYQYYRSRNITDVVVAAVTFARSILRTIPATVYGLIKDFICSAATSIKKWFKVKRTVATQAMSDKIKTLKNHVLSFLNSDFIMSLRNLTVSLASLKLFNKDVASKIYTTLGKPEKTDLISTISYITDQVATIFKFGESIRDGVAMSDILTYSENTSKLFEKMRELTFYENNTYVGIPVPGKMQVEYYMKQLRQTIASAEKIHKEMNPAVPSKTILHKELLNLKDIELRMTNLLNQGRRPMPVGVCIVGTPGTGKSGFVDFVVRVYCKVIGVEYVPDVIHHRSITSEYMEGYDPFSQIGIHYSEMGSVHENIVKGQGDKRLTEGTSMMDGLPFNVDRAFLDKGKCFARPHIVVFDTNVEDLNLNVAVNNRTAYERRLIYTRVRVKPEFQQLDGTGLDVKKSLEDPSDFMNRFLISVYVKIPIDNKRSKVQMLAEDVDIYEYANLMFKIFTDHAVNQDKLVDKFNDKFDINRYLTPEAQEQHLDLKNLFKSEAKELSDWFKKAKKDIRDALNIKERLTLYEQKVVEYEKQAAPNPKLVAYMDVRNLEMENLSRRPDKVVARWLSWGTSMSWNIMLLTMLNFASWSYGVIPDRQGDMISAPTQLSFGLSLVMGFFVSPLFYLGTIGVATFTIISGSGAATTLAKTVVIASLNKEIHKYKYRVKSLWHIHKPINFFTSPWWKHHGDTVVLLITTIGLLGTMYKFTSLFTNKKKEEKKEKLGIHEQLEHLIYDLVEDKQMDPESAKVLFEGTTEAHTDFKIVSEYNGKINEYEDEAGCGHSYKRIPIHGSSTIWNVKTEFGKPCAHTGDIKELYSSYATSVRSVIVNRDKPYRQYLMGYRGNYALINTHALGEVFDLEVCVSHTGDIRQNKSFSTTHIGVSNRRDIGDDISVIRLHGEQFKDRSIHFFDDVLTSSDYKGYFRGKEVLLRHKMDTLLMDNGKSVVSVEKSVCYSFPEHEVGMCGQPVFASLRGGACIIGFHAGANEFQAIGFAPIFNKSKIEKAIADMEKESNFFPIASKGVLETAELQDPISKSAFRYEELHGVKYYGKLPGKVIANQKSRLLHTDNDDEIEQIFEDELNFVGKIKYSKPMMQPTYVNGKYISPYNNALKKMSERKGTLDIDVLDGIVERLVARIVLKLKEKGIDSLAPLTTEVAINGIEHDGFLRRINVTTSGGYGWPGSKDKYVVKVVEENNTLIREPVEQLKKQIVSDFIKYQDGVCSHPIIEGLLKDEPRDIEKVLIGKTRIFYSTPIPALIEARMFLSPFFTLMVEHSEIFGCAIGINAHAQFDDLVKKMLGFSNKIGAGDFGNFDIRMPYEVVYAGNSVVYGVLRALGYNDVAMKFVAGILSDVQHPLISLLLDVLECIGLIVSGGYATAEKNCLYALILQMYAWYVHPQLQHLDFFDYVYPDNYGDDVQSAIKDEVIELYNNWYFQAVCEEVYKIEFTSPDKKTALKKYYDISECDFLKRRFIYRDDLNKWVGQLSLDSIKKSLQWYIPSKVVSVLEQMNSTYRSALWELFLHCDKEKFNSIRRKLIDTYERTYNCNERVSFPSYDEIRESIFPETL